MMNYIRIAVDLFLYTMAVLRVINTVLLIHRAGDRCYFIKIHGYEPNMIKIMFIGTISVIFWLGLSKLI